MNERVESSVPLVLVGAQGPWMWAALAAAVSQRGLPVLVPRLSATDGHDDPSGVDLDTWVDDIVDHLDRHGVRAARLLAHSFAGYTAGRLLERSPERVAELICLDAALPTPHRSWFDAAGPDTTALMRALARDHGDGTAVPWFSDEQLDFMFPGHGLSRATLAWVHDLVTAQSLASYEQVATTRDLARFGVPCTYLRCDLTPAVAPISAGSAGWRYETLAAGHWAMITEPELLAARLAALMAAGNLR